jgi:hypothetical protein
MDNVAMMAALGIAAVVDPLPAGDAQRARFVAYARSALLDPETGVMGFAIKGTGATPSRGSGAGWNSFYLPHVDAAFAAEQWAATARAFIVVVPPWFAALREFPHGRPGEGDVDSGPLVFGLSPAATGFAIAGARHANDAASLGGLLATAEVAGTTWVRPGRRSYLLAPDVGDAIVLAMRTARRFDRRFVAGAVAAPPP